MAIQARSIPSLFNVKYINLIFSLCVRYVSSVAVEQSLPNETGRLSIGLYCTMDIFLMTCLSVPRSVYGNSGVSQGYLCFVVWTQKSRHIIIWLISTVYYDYRNLQLKLISLVLIVSLFNGHVYADVIPICRSINVLWIKTISISKVTKYCAALSNAKLNRKWRPLKCIFHNRIRMKF